MGRSARGERPNGDGGLPAHAPLNSVAYGEAGVAAEAFQAWTTSAAPLDTIVTRPRRAGPERVARSALEVGSAASCRTGPFRCAGSILPPRSRATTVRLWPVWAETCEQIVRQALGPHDATAADIVLAEGEAPVS